MVAARAAETAYLRQYPQYAELWRSWCKSEVMGDPGRSAETNLEQADDAFQALPSWFTNTMTALLGKTASAVTAAEAAWHAASAKP